MKLSKVLLSTAIAFTTISAALPAIAQRPYIVSVPGKTNDGSTLKYDATSLDNYRGDAVKFTYYIIDTTSDLRQNRAITFCTNRNGWLVETINGGAFWVDATSNASNNMLNSVCNRVFPNWNVRR
ncbi:hypothetical protein [Nostoc phage A1]|nr:hypothetical protein [Nostoc phage A1]